MKKVYLFITCLLFIIIAIIALLRVGKLYNDDKLKKKKEEVLAQEKIIEELKKEISKYEELTDNSDGEFDWKQMLEMIEKYS